MGRIKAWVPHVQAWGMLLVVDGTLRITAASANVEHYLSVAWQDLLGQPLEKSFGAENANRLATIIHDPQTIFPYACVLMIRVHGIPKSFTVTVLAGENTPSWTLELEPNPVIGEQERLEFYYRINAIVARLREVRPLAALCQAAVDEIRTLLDFDRVNIFRFDADGVSHGIAEARNPTMLSVLNVQYPADAFSALTLQDYRQKMVRSVSHVRGEAVPIYVETADPLTPTIAAPGLKIGTLRATPVENHTLFNRIEVEAMLNFGIVVNERLWGIFICHHRTPLYVPHEIRTMCSMLATVLAGQITSIEEMERAQDEARLKVALLTIGDALALNESLGLRDYAAELLALVEAGGLVIHQAGAIERFGETPPLDALPPLLDWLDTQPTLYHTHRLALEYPMGAAMAGVASGVLALTITEGGPLRLVWFRPEKQHKRLITRTPENSEAGQSFEMTQGAALEWSPPEIEVMAQFQSALTQLQLRKAHRQAAQALAEEIQRRQIFSDFIRDASHDLRTPIAIINNNLYLLDLVRDEAKRTRFLEVIKLKMADLHRILEDMLEMARLDAHPPIEATQVDLNDVLRLAVEKITPLNTEKQHHLVFELTDPLPAVWGDPVLLDRCLRILADNALRYTESSGTIHFRTGVEGGYVSVEIQDSGVGIAPDDLLLIFQRFRRGDAARTTAGTGLGLSIAKRIVELHGGRLEVESQVGVGSIFRVVLVAQS